MSEPSDAQLAEVSRQMYELLSEIVHMLKLPPSELRDRCTEIVDQLEQGE